MYKAGNKIILFNYNNKVIPFNSNKTIPFKSSKAIPSNINNITDTIEIKDNGDIYINN